MILLCGIPSEAPLRLVSEAAEGLGVRAVLFNQRRTAEMRLAYSLLGHCEASSAAAISLTGVLTILDQVYPLDQFDGVYVRLMDYQQIPEAFEKIDGSEVRLAEPLLTTPANLQTAMIDWLEVASCRVMNRLSAMGSNQSKPYQAQLIARAGFLVPPSLVTNDPDAARTFLEAHGRVIYKSISAIRSIVQELDRARLRALDKIRYLPTQFQAFIPGENIRVHVAGEQVFATRIATPAVDYRYAGQDGLDFNMEAVYIESEVEQRCRELARLLELPLCGIDLKRTPSGEYYCFEANPSPAFSYYQEQTGQDIARAIVAYLEFGL